MLEPIKHTSNDDFSLTMNQSAPTKPSCVSSYFSDILSEHQTDPIVIPNTPPEQFRTFLELLKPPKCIKVRDEINSNNVIFLLPLSHKYKVQALFEECCFYLRRLLPLFLFASSLKCKNNDTLYTVDLFGC